MTDEIKTLKDFGFVQGEEEALKAEAIKHAKNCQHYGYIAELGWIMNFFNLTAEDLK